MASLIFGELFCHVTASHGTAAIRSGSLSWEHLGNKQCALFHWKMGGFGFGLHQRCPTAFSAGSGFMSFLQSGPSHYVAPVFLLWVRFSQPYKLFIISLVLVAPTWAYCPTTQLPRSPIKVLTHIKTISRGLGSLLVNVGCK